ncbi:LRR receptor-like serine/threonine-protein kinase EFR [Magnolia sinica]|uniref:LRR receptor-like serine/threonine-protein kinase EFR n=1 Tax=Magnolia sinica TaxID=86752 RepID=UPI00265A43D3|nr:LRR receptor-like serine/threonine-protein kinase EFR [Magnolia sinica]
MKNETDWLALLAFKDGISEDPLGVLSSWNNSLRFCQWVRATCSRRQHQRVTSLNLTDHSLVGYLSPHIGNLSFLRRIDLSTNKFKGEIPQEIGRLFRHQVLNLTENSFQGEIPSNLSHCSELIISIARNQLVGELPPELGSLSKLIFLSAMFNDLSGSIPPLLGNLSSLTTLFLRGANQFTGALPISLSNAISLEFVDFSSNSFSGHVPLNLGSLSRLYHFNIEKNQLGNREGDDLSFLTSLTNCTNLKVISASVNNLYGELPGSIANLWRQLNLLVLGRNKIFGIIPKGIENLISLYGLGLQVNSLKGTLPDSFGKLNKLQALSLYGNKFSGQIPPSIGNITQLSNLYLDVNDFHGSIPLSLEIWDLWNNFSFLKINSMVPYSNESAQLKSTCLITHSLGLSCWK